jgi:integrase
MTNSRSKTQRRRPNGEGSTWWDERRQRYVGQVSVHDHAGRRRYRTVVAKTQAELAARLDDLKTVVAASPDLPAAMTVSRFLTYWLDDVVAIEGKPRTARHYADIVRLYVDPTIGAVQLAKLEPAHVRQMIATLTRRGLSPNTVRLARSVLRRALRVGQADGFVDRNVAALVDGVNVPPPERTTLTVDEAQRLLDAADAVGESALVMVLLALGLRRGEALGLRWRDLDLDAVTPRLTVQGTLVKGDRGVHVWEQQAKTKGSRRTLVLPAAVVAVLRRHREAQSLERAVYGPEWARDARFDDMVFTSGTGTPRDLDRVTRLVADLSAAAGVGRWTPHGLRHSAASLLIAAKVPLKTVSEMLGHSSIRVTADVYGHLMEPARADAAEAMDQILSR